MTIAVVGPAGSGKTTYCRKFNKDIVHAVPKTSRWKFGKDNVGRIFHEMIISAEKLYVFAKLQLMKKNYIMDNCFVDAEAYGLLWSVKNGCSVPLILIRMLNKFAYKPDTIHQLVVEPGKAVNGHTLDETDLLNSLYIFTLKSHGYKQYHMKEYDLGVLIIWRKDNDESTIKRERVEAT